MEIQSYKCPNCGGGLVFDPKTQKFKCEYCLSAFTEETLKEMEEAARKAEEASKQRTGRPGTEEKADQGQAQAAAKNPEAEQSEQQAGNEQDDAGKTVAGAKKTADKAVKDEPKMVLYTCPSCGAEIVAQETTASTYCCYCHNPVVLSGSLDGKYRPDGLIPFEIDQKKAKELFKNWIQKKKYVPDDFYSPRQMEYLEGIYYPYWMYSCQASGEMQAEALRKRVTVAGEIEYIETSRYHLEKKANLPITDVARNALKQADRSLAETVLPFDMKKLRPFQAGYFLGFRAERRDREKEEFAQEIEQEVKAYTRESLQNSVSGYDHVDIRSHRETITGEKWNYAMLPVWMMTYPDPKSGQMYYFAMNGENGKVCGVLPVDSKKLVRLFLTVFIPVFALLLLGGYLI